MQTKIGGRGGGVDTLSTTAPITSTRLRLRINHYTGLVLCKQLCVPERPQILFTISGGHSFQLACLHAPIDAKPPEDSKKCINKNLQNNDLTIINFLPIKEEGSKEYINENKQNNELQISPTISFPPIKEEIKKIYKCDACDRFKDKLNLNIHFLTPYGQCKYKCDMGLKSKRHFNGDLVSHYEWIKYKCDVCVELIKDNKNFNRHRQFHYGQRKYKCDICDAVLKEKGNFNRHLLIYS
uniref:C2H2-type domain-containing protein n=1 Tax=Timema douglasi TaxID=61478 RepID=A0A7R8Z6L5_TIMDO|nr:unnamed protein product [Timema douglasi]